MTARKKSAAFSASSLPAKMWPASRSFGLFALQHRGQESAGIAVSDGKHIKIKKGMGLVTQIFDENTIKSNLPGDSAIGHTRYSTTGSSVLCNAQPLTTASKVGDIAVAHNGNLVNTAKLQSGTGSGRLRFRPRPMTAK